ncbi:hypothetical protein GCM10009721_22710 [Terrabacter tumescens]|uniref:Uncharacterized protein n=1 Tax=Terrabacter tumescens TaxID=60443 RepID=A0ABQ2HZ26_9MICO|nr:hypothetical protein [Terrabacter tumescens]GGM95714.1 hypothetical protein GCM10009721_22710 [Terrabacter tumescens]
MATRVLVTLSGESDPEEVVRALRALGPSTVHAPAPELPDVAVAEVDDDAVESFVRDAQSVDGVSVAEVDALRYTQSEPQSQSQSESEPADRGPGDSTAPSAGWSSTS